jgi:hypothetical protein
MNAPKMNACWSRSYFRATVRSQAMRSLVSPVRTTNSLPSSRTTWECVGFAPSAAVTAM